MTDVQGSLEPLPEGRPLASSSAYIGEIQPSHQRARLSSPLARKTVALESLQEHSGSPKVFQGSPSKASNFGRGSQAYVSLVLTEPQVQGPEATAMDGRMNSLSNEPPSTLERGGSFGKAEGLFLADNDIDIEDR
jgi:hypothetical protein